MNVTSGKSLGSGNCNKNEKKGAAAFRTIYKMEKLNGRRYKEFLKSRAKKPSASVTTSLEKDKLSQGEGHGEAQGPNKVEKDNLQRSITHSPGKRVDFWLRQVKDSPLCADRSNQAAQRNDDDDCFGGPSLMEHEHIDTGLDVSESQLDQAVSEMKHELRPIVASQCKSAVANFVEYWVPVKLSNIQIEQYCGFLFSNSRLLCAEFKPDFDSSDILQDMLISMRKLCDHPYLVDRSLRTSLIQGIPESEQLDAEIQLSSKLHLLHKILQEIKQRGLRALILYQSLGGSGLVSAGDILDDILHEKFGGDSFVRIHGGISRKKKKDLLNIFNDKGSKGFVCLIETRDCVPSFRLSSIDTVILFNSDWDPMNDMKALRKINLHSQFEQVKVFRLYSCNTLEEKALILAKLGMPVESNVINIKQNICHGLLTWGTPYLLEKLDEFHKSNTEDTKSIISSGASFVDGVFHELSSLLPNNVGSSDCTTYSLVLEVQTVDGIYPRGISLHGELESSLIDNFSLVEEMVDNEPPCVLWINLLRGRKPQWKYLSSESRRARKRVRYERSSLEETPSKKNKNENKITSHHIPAILNRGVRDRLPIQGRKRKRSGCKKKFPLHQNVKDIDVKPGEIVVSHVGKRNRANMLRRKKTQKESMRSSKEPKLSAAKNHLLPTDQLPANSHCRVPESRKIQNGHAHCTPVPSSQNQAALQAPVEDSTRPLASSLQHSRNHVSLQTPCILSHMEQSGPQASAETEQLAPNRPLESSDQHSLRHVPLHTSNNSPPAVNLVREPSVASLSGVPLTSQSYEPVGASTGTNSNALTSVCSSLQTELEKLEKEKNRILEQHEKMKQQTKMECEREIEQIQKKYDMLLQDSETTFVEEKKLLETWYNRVYCNKKLAEAMILRDGADSATLSRVTKNHLMEGICQLILQQTCQAIENQPMSIQSSSPCPTKPLPVMSIEVARSQSYMTRSLRTTSRSSPASRHDRPPSTPCMSAPQNASSMSTNHSLTVQQITARDLYSTSSIATGSPSITQVMEMNQLLAVNSTKPGTVLNHRQTVNRHAEAGLNMNSAQLLRLPQSLAGVPTSPIDPMPDQSFTCVGNLQAGYGVRAPPPHLRNMRHLPTLSSSGSGTLSPVGIQQVTSDLKPQQSLVLPSFVVPASCYRS